LYGPRISGWEGNKVSASFLTKVFGPPAALVVLGGVPGVGGVPYSGHGGLVWPLLPLCLPYIVLVLAFNNLENACRRKI
jgi:hypothetical protein